jgi:hypothetical protein
MNGPDAVTDLANKPQKLRQILPRTIVRAPAARKLSHRRMSKTAPVVRCRRCGIGYFGLPF